jgi:hypothetical protein
MSNSKKKEAKKILNIENRVEAIALSVEKNGKTKNNVSSPRFSPICPGDHQFMFTQVKSLMNLTCNIRPWFQLVHLQTTSRL